MTDETSGAHFPTTCWSRVVAAGDPHAPMAREALVTLCENYWFPLYAAIRRRGYGPHEAQDLTQDLFATLLEKGVFAKADPARGRFRTFLRAVCDHFLANHRDRENAQKRGGGHAAAIPFDLAESEVRYSREPAHELTPERVFDHAWAMTLLGRTLDRLGDEYRAADQHLVFAALAPVLTDGSLSGPYAAFAVRLGMTEGAVRVAVHRMRRRYGDLLREEIASTVDDPSEVDDEIRALFATLGS
jgi:RNA polymerase sigma-70 factor (ECF subfamily)